MPRVALLLGLLAATADAAAEEPRPARGQVCVRKVLAIEPKGAMVPKGGATLEAGAEKPKKHSGFSVQFDERPRVPATTTEGGLVADLDLDAKHRVRIFDAEGRPTTAWTFRFSDYKTDKLSLWRNGSYDSWFLGPWKRGGCP